MKPTAEEALRKFEKMWTPKGRGLCKGLSTFPQHLHNLISEHFVAKEDIAAVKSEPAEGAEGDIKYRMLHQPFRKVLQSVALHNYDLIVAEGDCIKIAVDFVLHNAQKIADKMVEGMYPKEFVWWKDKNVMRCYEGWMFNYGANLSAKFKDYDELFNYWKENVK